MGNAPEVTPSKPALPPGQFLSESFDRFGLGLFANRFPANVVSAAFTITGDVAEPILVGSELGALPRVEQISGFHCVTTWSCVGIRWSGVRFADFYERIVLQRAQPTAGATLVVFRAQDGYCCSMQLGDLMATDVILADRLDGAPLGIDHGAPLRLVAPAHYGYKNVKHLAAIEFWRDRSHYHFPFRYPDFMDHPRGRVMFEERACYFPAWLLRPIYAALIGPVKRKSQRALKAYLRRRQQEV